MGERNRLLLYAPPPAAASAWVAVLQSEGVEVLVATSLDALTVLLDTTAPHIVLALVPMLGEPVRELLRRKAPQAELRVVSGLGALLEDRVLPPAAALDFSVRAVSAVAEAGLGEPLGASELSARLSLSDLDRSAPDYPTVSYEELGPGVSLLGRFRILADLGEGGLGRVFKGQDERLEEEVVIKVMKDSLSGDPKLLEHFKREIRLARRISHPAVVRTYDFWEAGPLKFVTMEFLEGVDVRHEVRRRGAFPLPVALRLGSELLDGLAAAHELGVVHRDIKPHNVYLLKGGRLKILDFGIAQGLDLATPDGRTPTTSPIGTPEYMSPEQLMGDRLDARTDLYSAGLVLFEMITGRLPFAGTDRMTLATQRLHAVPARASSFVPAVPGELDELLLRLLNRERDGRFPSAQAALAALREIPAE